MAKPNGKSNGKLDDGEVLASVRSPRKQRFVKGLLEGKTQEQAALAAGYSPSTARTKSSTLLTADVRAAIDKALDKEIRLSHAIKRLKEGLDAEDQEVVMKRVDDKNISEVARKPNMYVRHKYLETYFKLKGALGGGAGGTEINDSNVVVVFDM
jgi:phage terminase small subunit